MATSIIDEFVTLLGIDLSPDTMQRVRRFEQGLNSVSKIALGVSAAITAAAGSIGYFAEKAVESASHLDKFAELTGESAQSVQRWSYAVEQAGGKASSAQSDIMGLVKAMNPVMPGEFNHGLFMLGMYEKKYKDVGAMLVDLSSKFQGMSAGKQLNWASQVGISPDLLLLLRRGPQAIKGMMGQTPFLMSDEELKKARMLETLINRIKYSFTTVATVLSVEIAPQIEKILDPLDKWIEKNHEIVGSGIKAFLEGVAEGFEKVWNQVSSGKDWLLQTLPVLGTFVESLTDANSVGHITAGILMGIVVALALGSAQWVAIGVAIAAAGMVVDDFCTYLEGGNSLIGDTIGYLKSLYTEFSTKFPNIAKFISIVIDGLKFLGKLSLDLIIYAIKDLWGAICKIADVFATTLKGLAWLLNLLLEPFVSLFGDGKDNPVGSPDQGPKPISDTNRKILSEGLSKALLQFQAAPLQTSAPVTNNTTDQSSSVTNVTNNNTYNIETKSTDAYGIAKELSFLYPNFKVQGQAAGAQ